MEPIKPLLDGALPGHSPLDSWFLQTIGSGGLGKHNALDHWFLHLMGLYGHQAILPDHFSALNLIDIAILNLGCRAKRESIILAQEIASLVIKLVYVPL